MKRFLLYVAIGAGSFLAGGCGTLTYLGSAHTADYGKISIDPTTVQEHQCYGESWANGILSLTALPCNSHDPVFWITSH